MQIIIDGSIGQTSGWLTFLTDSMNFTEITSAKLLLYVRSLVSPGTLKFYLLKQRVTASENNVTISDLKYYSGAFSSIYLGSADIEKIIQIDITDSLRNGNFYGIALVSDDGLIASFDAKECISKPMILLTTRIVTRSSKWYSGTSFPPVDSGLSGDYFLNCYNGNVYQKKVGGWSFLMNIIGPQGPAGTTGPSFWWNSFALL